MYCNRPWVCISILGLGIKKMTRQTGRPAIRRFELKKKENYCIQVLNARTGLAVQNSNCSPNLTLAGY